MKKLAAFLLIIFSLSIFTIRIKTSIVFEQNVTGFLKRAADANTIDLAKKELAKALTYLEKNEITSGYTSILWKTPDEDIGFWYENIKASYNELNNLGQSSSLEKTNTLIKLRETLLDHGGEGKEKVTRPDGISAYPNNVLWTILLWSSILSLVIALYVIIPKNKKKVEPEEKTAS